MTMQLSVAAQLMPFSAVTFVVGCVIGLQSMATRSARCVEPINYGAESCNISNAEQTGQTASLIQVVNAFIVAWVRVGR
jgi:hypothetical protein